MNPTIRTFMVSEPVEDGDVPSGRSPLPVISIITAVRNLSLIAQVSAGDFVRLPEHSTHVICGEGD